MQGVLVSRGSRAVALAPTSSVEVAVSAAHNIVWIDVDLQSAGSAGPPEIPGGLASSVLYFGEVSGLMALTERYVEADPVNIGADEEVTIGALARTIVELSRKDVDITFDPSKPAGQPRRKCDTRKAREKVGFEARVSLPDGLEETLAWYEAEVMASRS